jgi:hypothetical protein
MSLAVGVDLLELKSLLCLTRTRQESITVDTAVPADHPLRYRLCFVWPIVRIAPTEKAPAAPPPVLLEGGAMIVVPPPSDHAAPSQLVDGDVDAPGDAPVD